MFFPYYITHGNVFCYYKNDTGEIVRFKLFAEHLSYIISYVISLNTPLHYHNNPLEPIYEHYKRRFTSMDKEYNPLLN